MLPGNCHLFLGLMGKAYTCTSVSPPVPQFPPFTESKEAPKSFWRQFSRTEGLSGEDEKGLRCGPENRQV